MNPVITNITDFSIRFAEKKDASLIVKYIRDLATYENELEDVYVTTETLEKYMFDNNGAEALIGMYNGNPVGFALFHYSFSTFLGRPGIALVDLYIEPDFRGNGFGKAMLSYLAQLTVKRDCGRLEWWCHDWNKPAIERYLNWGANPEKNIRVYRLTNQVLFDFAKEYKSEK
jgi:GNAT superfamily N-acetyltransferase